MGPVRFCTTKPSPSPLPSPRTPAKSATQDSDDSSDDEDDDDDSLSKARRSAHAWAEHSATCKTRPSPKGSSYSSQPIARLPAACSACATPRHTSQIARLAEWSTDGMRAPSHPCSSSPPSSAYTIATRPRRGPLGRLISPRPQRSVRCSGRRSAGWRIARRCWRSIFGRNVQGRCLS